MPVATPRGRCPRGRSCRRARPRLESTIAIGVGAPTRTDAAAYRRQPTRSVCSSCSTESDPGRSRRGRTSVRRVGQVAIAVLKGPPPGKQVADRSPSTMRVDQGLAEDGDHETARFGLVRTRGAGRSDDLVHPFSRRCPRLPEHARAVVCGRASRWSVGSERLPRASRRA